MRPTSAFLFVLIFTGHLVVSTHGICGPDKYPVSKYPGGKCLKCAECQEGQGLVPKCGTPIVYEVDKIDCEPCEPGKFSDKYDSSSCNVCHQCAENENSVPCNSTSDTVCKGTCKKGFYFSKKDGTHSCQKCSHCCFDDQDEEVPECKEQGFTESKQYCAPRPDKDCAPPSHAPTGGKYGSDSSNDKLSQTKVIVIGVVAAIAVVIAVATTTTTYFCWKRKQRTNNQIPFVGRYAMNGPAADSDNKEQFSDFSKAPQNADNEKPSNNGQAIRSVASLHEDLPATQDPSANNATSASCGSASCEKNILTHQKSKDSQKSGVDDADAGNHRRSSSFSNVAESFKKRMPIKRQGSLVHNEEQETDEVPGPIKIIQDLKPSSQEKKEGSKVEFVFKCVAQVRDCKLIYKWFKDGVKLSERNSENTLRLKSVTLPDFGWYKCQVSCEGNSSDFVESSPSELNVTPRDGTKYKSLKDLHRQDFQTYERVGRLLSQKKHGLGGWREVAFKYGMNHLDIDALGNDPEAGSKTLDFLGSVVPGLTVYDFCKTLKEHNIRRLDIVQELENHFSATGTAFV